MLTNLELNPIPYQYPIKARLQSALAGLPPVEIDTVSDFLSSMLQIDPGRRMSADAILHHKWLSENVAMI